MDLVLLGLTIGMANALLAVGLVLIYMSNRVVNFAGPPELAGKFVELEITLAHPHSLRGRVAMAPSARLPRPACRRPTVWREGVLVLRILVCSSGGFGSRPASFP